MEFFFVFLQTIFNTLVFATVENRDPAGLVDGLVEVRFESVSSEEVNQFVKRKEVFVMIESPAYFESYRHVLEALKEINSEFPFQKQIVGCCRDVEPPEYQIKKENNSNFKFNFDDVLVTKREAYSKPSELIEKQDSRSAMEIVPDASASVEVENAIPSAAEERKCTPNDYCWPDRASLGLNESQMRAFKMALTKRFAVIQGPPGTGKTYVGWKIARVLLLTHSLWEDKENQTPILMVSYTNHALDQFLEGLLSTTTNVVRVGGRSRSEKLDRYSLKYHQRLMRSQEVVPDEIYRARIHSENDTHRQKRFSESSLKILSTLKTSVVSMKVLGHRDYALRAHYSQLLEEGGPESINEALLDWLQIERQDQHEEELLPYGDYEEEEYHSYGYGVAFDNEPFDDKNLREITSEIAILSAEEAADPKEVRRNLLSRELMSEDEEMHVRDIYRLGTEDRWRLYRLWRKRAEEHHNELFLTRQGEYEQAIEREREITKLEEYEILRKARVIGMTTTCAAKYRSILTEIGPRIVIVEEAAEVLEAHIIASLTPGCQHLILIGDHKQLRPTPAVHELAKKFKLDVSLFERMVNVGVQCEMLNVQHRMRPEIAALMKHIYDNLENHKSVEEYEDVKGIKKNMFFINHNHMEESSDQLHSHVNKHEAKFSVALCRYLLQQGYEAHQITLLTTYMGQMFALKDCLQGEEEDSPLRGVRRTTVDNFQGEENDIILLSLVRSNKDEKIGFLKIVNRACVALSRARKGFFCIGNFGLLSKHSDIWKKIVADLKASTSIGNALPLVCQIHKDEVSVATAEDFNTKVPMGGCQQPCAARLKCGHACPLKCHPYDKGHREFRCEKPCEKKRERCGHSCPKRCGEVCEQLCDLMVEKELPICGHTTKVRCDTSPEMMKCKKRCERVLPCAHRCQRKCTESCTEKCQELVKRTDWPCGHEVTMACSATLADCPVPCGPTLECGHPCSGTCGECRMGRIHKQCKLRCGRVQICSHSCKSLCRESCPPCIMMCENKCQHNPCPNRCGELCIPCREECPWKCSHHACTKKCSEMCDRPRCNVPCYRFIPECGHVCCGLECEKECICAECTPEREIIFGTEEDENARFIRLPDCQHIFEVTGLDRWMDGDDDVIGRKQCPQCKTPVQTCLRYGNVIKQQLHDIERVKAKMLGNKTELNSKKMILHGRAIVLLEKLRLDGTPFSRKVTAYLEKRKDRIRQSMKSETIAAIIENQLMLIHRLFSTGKKMQSVLGMASPEDSSEKKLQRQQFTEELNYLEKRLLSDRVGQLELQDINTEFSRFNLQLEMYLLNRDITSLELELDEPSCQMKTAIQKELSSGQRIADEELDKLMHDIATIRTTNPCFKPLTPEEKKQMVSAMNLKPGHWYKCPQGHIYVITECGGAMQKSTCPDCGSVIGGENHTLVEDNQVASEMDGARYAAWSEQANLANYGNLDEIV
ncbi:NFX1-type zinc finger-containing protein 1-like [Stylophora pistillata]|uniref:NFX1-type zinc finger-containing protein 1-like n=1 Tax=Stylophora pistillata TaxID=50429 RepID=UPI000C055E56|nr:NFX1-type zinc finger-containing protein 1-like [Stylophora pistillata]